MRKLWKICYNMSMLLNFYKIMKKSFHSSQFKGQFLYYFIQISMFFVLETHGRWVKSPVEFKNLFIIIYLIFAFFRESISYGIRKSLLALGDLYDKYLPCTFRNHWSINKFFWSSSIPCLPWCETAIHEGWLVWG